MPTRRTRLRCAAILRIRLGCQRTRRGGILGPMFAAGGIAGEIHATLAAAVSPPNPSVVGSVAVDSPIRYDRPVAEMPT